MRSSNSIAFFELLRAGLWSYGNKEIRIDGTTDWNVVYQIAQEQSVLGLVLAGMERSAVKPPKELLLQWIGEVQQIEKRNKAMNGFVADLIDKLRKEDIYCLLVKGQGVAQCYERPLWRCPGDIDFFLSEANYIKAREYLIPLASHVDSEDKERKHLSIAIDSFIVELHGTLWSGLWKNVDTTLDEVQYDVFCGGNVRSWMCEGSQIFLPKADEDVFIVFSHILQHFFRGGIGLRQVCDWISLLWIYKDKINFSLLEKRIQKAGIMSEWKAFAALAVDWLGMPSDTIPFYSSSHKWSRKGKRVLSFILETGNFGHKIITERTEKRMFIVSKLNSLLNNTRDSINHLFIFPLDSIKVWFLRFMLGIKVAIRG